MVYVMYTSTFEHIYAAAAVVPRGNMEAMVDNNLLNIKEGTRQKTRKKRLVARNDTDDVEME